MPRHAALLRGVSPMNLKMPVLKQSLEGIGMTDVVTLLSSGNVVFSCRKASVETLQKKCEEAVLATTGRHFMTIVRSLEDLQALVDSDPYSAHRVPAGAKRIVTFLREPPDPPKKLPIEKDRSEILALRDREALGIYVPTPKGPVFMTLLEKTFGKDITTRTWDTVVKITKKAA